MKPRIASDPSQTGPLSEFQKTLVRENLKLVTVHLHRHFADERRRPDGPDFWDELFQDGCLGLIEAARTFDPAGPGRFAPYALHRIHSAVSGSLRRGRSSIRLPERATRPEADGRTGDPRQDPSAAHQSGPRTARRSLPKVVSYPDAALDARPARSSTMLDPDSGEPADHGTIGSRPQSLGQVLRSKIEAAVEAALDRTEDAFNARRGRQNLARLLVEQRIMIPEEYEQAALRSIAEQSGSSYGRVAHCETTLLTRIRGILNDEAEFALLRKAARREPHGMAAPLDSGLEDWLRDAAASQTASVFAAAWRGRRAEILLTVVENLGLDVGPWFRAYAARLDPAARTAWLAAITAPDGAGGLRPHRLDALRTVANGAPPDRPSPISHES